MDRTQIWLILFSAGCLIFGIGWSYDQKRRNGGVSAAAPPPIVARNDSAWNHTVSMLMVKNEASIIARSVTSLQAHVGRYVFLCDTGSSDATLDNALEASSLDADISIWRLPGGFVHFEQARNACREALAQHVPTLATRIDWVALPDADFEARLSNQAGDSALPAYDVNAVQIRGAHEGMPHNSLHLLVRAPHYFEHCRYRLWTHEYLDCSRDGDSLTYGYHNYFHFLDHADGSNREGKLKRDIELLRRWLAVVNETELRPRALYYLARAYDDSNKDEQALKTYARHDAEQTHTNYLYLSAYRRALIGRKQWKARCDADKMQCENGLLMVSAALLDAFHTYDGYFRREPLYHLASLHRRFGNYPLCLLYAAAALHLPALDYSRIPLEIEVHLHGSTLQAEYDYCARKLKAKA
jgi:glycosyltransferase involved in cell wall biosynthesis